MIAKYDQDVECQIIADEVENLTPYIDKLFEWATTAWDYNTVEDWNTDEYYIVATQEGYYKVHKLRREDKEGLFNGKYIDSPAPLEDYEYLEIHAYVYMEISEEEYEELNEGEGE